MQTLILSEGYEPIQPITWQRAMTLWFAGRVDIVERYQTEVIRTAHSDLPMPAVVRLNRGGGRVARKVRFSKRHVYLRDKRACQYCARELILTEATLDHVVPRCQAGRTSWENIVLACMTCNQAKGPRTPVQAGMPLRTRPTRPRSLPLWQGVTFRQGMPSAWRAWLPC